MKEKILNFRVPVELNDDMDIFCAMLKINKSTFIRDAVTNQMEEILSATTVKNEMNIMPKDVAPLKTLGFSELVFFIYDKKHDPEIHEYDFYLKQHIILIQTLLKNPLFTEEIKCEFEKVLRELEVVYSGKKDLTYFTFPFTENGGFNYTKFRHFMHGLRYDDQLNRVLNIR